MTGVRKTRRKGGRYRPEFCDAVRELGRKGFSITEAGKELGIPYCSLLYWERTYPEFGVAFAKVRKNSEYRKLLRHDKLLSKTEEQLVLALARIRAKRESEKKKIEAKLRQKMGVNVEYRARETRIGETTRSFR